MTLVASKKPPANLRKKRFGEHPPSKNFLKPYWPYLPLIAIVGLGLLVNNLWSNSRASVLGYATDLSAQTILMDTNTQRASEREAPLKLNSKLAAAAQAKASDMSARDYWSHDTPDGQTPWSFIARSGYNYQKAGENLAYGFASAGSTVTGWMNSPEHRANILNKDYADVGFGIANVPNYRGQGPETLIVAMYAQPTTIATAAAVRSLPPALHQTAPLTSAPAAEPAAQPVARIQLLTAGSAPWSLFVASTLASLAVVVFVLRHGLFWRRALVTSEAFVIHHPLFDIAIVSVATLGLLLSHTAGVIR